jgi:hypothetical protein
MDVEMQILDAILLALLSINESTFLFPRKDYGEMEMTAMPQLITKIIDTQSTSSFCIGDINGI